MIVSNPIKKPLRMRRVRDVRIYFTQRWKRTRKNFLEQNPFCRHCEEKGIYKPAVDVDHIIELRDGGLAYDESNLQGLCKRHHAIKSMKRRR